MKALQHITIILFALASVFMGLYSYGQVTTGHLVSKDEFAWPQYKPQKKWDTVKIRILYDDGNSHPSQMNGYIVRQWNVWYGGIDPGACANCPPQPPDKWIDTEDMLESNKFNTVDTRKVWNYKYFNWH